MSNIVDNPLAGRLMKDTARQECIRELVRMAGGWHIFLDDIRNVAMEGEVTRALAFAVRRTRKYVRADGSMTGTPNLGGLKP